MSKEIQNKEVILPGGLGSIINEGKVYDVTEVREETHPQYGFCGVTFTLRPEQGECKTEDADFEVIPQKQLPDANT